MIPGRDLKIKICGITTPEDARLAAEAVADYIGVVVEVGFSPRSLTVEQARPIFERSPLPVVALLFNRAAEEIRGVVEALRPHAVQLLGQEPPSLVKALKSMVACELWKSLHLPPQGMGEIDIAEYQGRANALVDAGIDAIVIDTVAGSPQEGLRYGGTGQVSNWATARRLVESIPVPTFLAGGIDPENVQEAIEVVHPHGIDLCSGVEFSPGHKDPEKLRRLVLAVSRAIAGSG